MINVNVCRCSRNVKLCRPGVAQGKGAVGVGSGVVLSAYEGKGGRQVIVGGVVRFIDFSVDDQEINIFAVHPCNGQIVEIARNGAVAVNQRWQVYASGVQLSVTLPMPVTFRRPALTLSAVITASSMAAPESILSVLPSSGG